MIFAYNITTTDLKLMKFGYKKRDRILVNGKNASNRHQTINVGRSIQRIKANDVFTTLIILDFDNSAIFFGHKQTRSIRRLKHVYE